jgi:hypothetical protein
LEHAAKNMSKEFERQIRITNRTIRAIVSHRILLNPLRFGIFSFELVSHKICKLFVPFFLILCLVSNLLVVNTSMVYAALLSVQVAFYILAVARAPLKGFSSLVSIPKTFAMTNCAIAIGWLKYLKGETFTTWGPSR